MSSARLLVCTRKGLFVLAPTASGWSIEHEAHVGARALVAAEDPHTGHWYAGVQHGHWGPKLHRSSDRGRTWQELPTPKYPPQAETKPGEPATLRSIFALATGGADQPGRVYVGSEPGGLFMSDDQGESFQLCAALWDHPSRAENWFGGGLDAPAIHSILVDPRDSRRVRVGISCAGMFETDDDGASWRPRNQGLLAEFLPNPDVEVGHDPHLIVQCPAQPDKLWQQNHCGIFHSDDAGASWRCVSQREGERQGPAHFGFAVAVDERDGDRAWVLPLESDEVRVAHGRRLSVSRTDDGGRTWASFTAGLPSPPCFDFAFRHALDLRGGRLAFGTAAGSLFTSDDGGESWHTAAQYLPPIYAVRWAAA